MQTIPLPILDTTGVAHFSVYVPPQPFFSTSDIIAIGAAIISLLTLSFTFYSVYLNKELDIKFKKFESLGIDTIKLLFEPIDQIFNDHPEDQITNYLSYLTEYLVDIELFLIEFNDLYTKLEIKEIILIKEKLTDELYNNPQLVKEKKVIYMAYKAKMINRLYDFAMMDDIGLWHRFLRFAHLPKRKKK